MTDSGAVYQPTTVGYTYDTGGDGGGGGGRVVGGFLGILSRNKVSSRKWLEWALLLIALVALVSGLTTMLVNLVSVENAHKVPEANTPEADSGVTGERGDNGSRGSIAAGAALMLVGVLAGCAWAWLRFFRPSKSPRSGLSGGSGQMLGGLNPSTDLLVGSTSQYGPVLTELPSQQVNAHETPAIPLSDQEEETRTLMQESAAPVGSSGGAHAIANQIPG
ncbi:uncharacterized protein LOC107275076 isoform X1 [Cephus cinctus]|uniref:Uncharacterized protein LOC107275076 isoform X1 n=1 Tax=Cephus cinctus TaxID=211228 RepID=A0AAJ7FVG0_CEPCN|nr:uncharacterized protein LOC107275076 isoform X1 [Cephus cinctus]